MRGVDHDHGFFGPVSFAISKRAFGLRLSYRVEFDTAGECSSTVLEMRESDMKLLYEASDTLEAHMILNLLENAGLSARVDGEYLQGGVGELQAIGIVRVMIEELDYPEAKLIVQKWDEKQPAQEEPRPQLQKNSGSLGRVFVAFFCGVAATAIYFQTPVTGNGIDYNGDGKFDEVWSYVNYRLAKSEVDRNLDGNFDGKF